MRLATAFTIILLAPVAAFAADGRDIDFTQPLKAVTGDVITQPGKDGKPVPMTLGDVAAIALETLADDERSTTDGMKKFQRDQIARKVYGNPHASLSPEDLAIIKERIGKVWGPSQIGASWPLLDPTLNK